MYNQLNWSERGTANPEVVGSIPAKTQKIENSHLHGFELHKPTNKCTKLLLQVIQASSINRKTSSEVASFLTRDRNPNK